MAVNEQPPIQPPNPRQESDTRAILDVEERSYLLDMRQGLLMQLRAIEKRLGMPLSVPPRRRRDDLN
jgi:hypothetical protein